MKRRIFRETPQEPQCLFFLRSYGMSHPNEKFVTAAQEAKQLAQRPNNDTMLKLYALYKQGMQGDVTGKRPGMMDMVGRAKYDAWAKLRGTSLEDAQQQYIDLVEKLKG